jgi:hypothetical protein
MGGGKNVDGRKGRRKRKVRVERVVTDPSQ